MAKSQAIEEKKNTLPVGVNFEDDAGSGFEHADVEAFAVPFLAVLQKLSPQVDEDSATRIEGAKAGMLFNTVTEQYYPAKSEDGDYIEIVPVAYKRQFLEWAPRSSDKGLVGVYDVAEGLAKIELCDKDDKGRPVTADGNTIADSRMHYVLAKLDGNWTPVIIAMSSTQIKHSRKWMTVMDNLKFARSDGTKYTPAMYSHIYKAATQHQENSEGSWRGWKIELSTVISDAELYRTAKEFRDKVMANEVEIAERDTAEQETPEI